jgi:hypothetical protein
MLNIDLSNPTIRKQIIKRSMDEVREAIETVRQEVISCGYIKQAKEVIVASKLKDVDYNK